MEWSTDVGEAAWFLPELGGWGELNVGSFVPSSLPAIGRLFHPVEIDYDNHTTWAAVAEDNGRIAHPEMQFHAIATPHGEAVDWPGPQRALGPWFGELPEAEALVLAESLTGFTTTPDDCFFGVWDGYGQIVGGGTSMSWVTPTTGPFVGLRGKLNKLRAERVTVVGTAPPHIINGPRIDVPNRGHLLMRGALSNLNVASTILGEQTPNIWWPKDRAWFVASEIDYSWTYVAGSETMLTALLDHPKLEVMRSERHHGCTASADSINT